MIGSPMGAGGFGTLASHFPDRTVVTYDPRGVERSTKADPASRVDARAARRRPASDHRRTGRRPGRPLRQQWRRGERARPGGRAPGGRPDARRARAAAGLDPARPRGRAGRLPRPSHETYQRAASVPAWRTSSSSSSHQGPMTARVRRRSRVPIRPCSGCPPRTTATGPTRCCSRTSSPAPTTSPTSTPCARRRRGSCSAAGVESEGQTGASWRGRGRRAARHGAGPVPERPRRLPRWRVRPGRRSGRVRRQAARGPRRSLTSPDIAVTRAGGDLIFSGASVSRLDPK